MLLDFTGNEREPLLRGVTSESRQYTSNEPAGTFFTPMDSPDHSDREDDNLRRPDSSRTILTGSDAFPPKPLAKLPTEMVGKNCGVTGMIVSVILSKRFTIDYSMFNRKKTIKEERAL